MKQRNWDRLQDGDKIISTLSGNERTIASKNCRYWRLTNGGHAVDPANWRLHPATKARLRAQDAPPADPAPVPLTADDSYNGEVNIQYPPTPEPLGPLSDESKAKLRAHEAARKASATLAVGDTVEVTGPSNAGSNYIGLRGKVVDLAIGVTDLMYVQFDDAGIGPAWFPASSLRRVQPAPDVQPAAGYVAGQAVECDSMSGKATGQFVCELDPGFYAVLIGNSPIDHRYRAADIRPCPASACCVVMDRQSGEYKIYDGRIVRWPCPAPGTNYTEPFDPTRHAVMLLPRQPAAPAEQPAATAYCPKCHHALGQADKHGCKCAAPAEQPCTMCGGSGRVNPCPDCIDDDCCGCPCPDCTPAEQPAPLKGDTHEQR